MNSNNGVQKRQSVTANNGGQVVAAQTITHRSGPLPSADELALYNQVVPGAAERIIKMAESQHEHRLALERDEATRNTRIVEANASYAGRGQWMAFTITTAAFVLGTFMALNGQVVFAGLLFSSVLVGLVSNFIAGKSKNKD